MVEGGGGDGGGRGGGGRGMGCKGMISIFIVIIVQGELQIPVFARRAIVKPSTSAARQCTVEGTQVPLVVALCVPASLAFPRSPRRSHVCFCYDLGTASSAPDIMAIILYSFSSARIISTGR